MTLAGCRLFLEVLYLWSTEFILPILLDKMNQASEIYGIYMTLLGNYVNIFDLPGKRYDLRQYANIFDLPGKYINIFDLKYNYENIFNLPGN